MTNYEFIRSYIKHAEPEEMIDLLHGLLIEEFGAKTDRADVARFLNRKYEFNWNKQKEVKQYSPKIVDNNNRCIYCNSIIPEGRHVCPSCKAFIGWKKEIEND